MGRCGLGMTKEGRRTTMVVCDSVLCLRRRGALFRCSESSVSVKRRASWRVAGVVEVVDAKVMVDDGEEELARWVLGSRRVVVAKRGVARWCE
ncbi:hypothetical protein HN51_041523 [Arachis hypogaea]